MFKKRLAVVLSALWIIVMVASGLIYVNKIGSRIEYSYGSDYVQAGETTTYVADNSTGCGAIYRLDDSGKVENLIVTHYTSHITRWRAEYICRKSMAESSDGVYVLFVDPSQNEDGRIIFRIVQYSKNLKTEKMSGKYFVRAGARVSGISVQDDVIYVTEISEDRKDAFVYEISEDHMLDTAKLSTQDKKNLDGDAVELEAGGNEKAPAGKYFAEAEYSEGMLFSRMDGQQGEEYFGDPREVKKLFDNRRDTLIQRLLVVGLSPYFFILALVVGVIIIVAMIYSLASRRRMVYRIAVFEFLLFVMLSVGMSVVIISTDDSLKQQFIHYEEFTLESMANNLNGIVGTSDTFDKNVYPSVLGELTKISSWSNAVISTYDVCIVDSATGVIQASAQGYSQEDISFVFGKKAAQEIMSDSYVMRSIRVDIGGNRYIMVIDPNSGLKGNCLVAVAKNTPILSYIFSDRMSMVVVIILIFLGISLLGCSVIYQEGRDLRELGIALEELAEGREDIRKPTHLSAWDMNRMWNIIQEIQRKLQITRYSKYLIYEAYYRFAPKGVERVLKKESITEIKSRDMIERSGTLCHVTTGGGGSADALEKKDAFLDFLEKYREQEDGVFISSDLTISDMQILFLEKIRTTVRFGVDLLSEYQSIDKQKRLHRVTLILHYTPFTYGVVGTKDHVCPFLSSYEMEELSKYAEWFSECRVGMVITEAVREREQGSFETRYIGFIQVDKALAGVATGAGHGEIDYPEGRNRLKLYEVIDADSAVLRNTKRRLAADFAEGLSLFYQRDFYLARNAFTEVIRQNPKDAIARWYLFECERYLNMPTEKSFVGAIHL